MSYEEIVKALEEMAAEHEDNFSGKVLDLIKRQQERIEALEFLDAHRMYAVLGELEEYEKFYTTSDIKIGLRIAIDTLKKGVFGKAVQNDCKAKLK